MVNSPAAEIDALAITRRVVPPCACCQRRARIKLSEVADAMSALELLPVSEVPPGVALSAVRRALQLSQQQFADALGVSVSRVRDREWGRRQDTTTTMVRRAIKLARAAMEGPNG